MMESKQSRNSKNTQNYLDLYSKSKNVFLAAYRKCSESSLLEHHTQLFREMEKRVIRGDLSGLRALCRVLVWITSVSPAVREIYSGPSHVPPVFVGLLHLACKLRKVDILRHLVSDCGNIGPALALSARDDEGHHAFYYAIRSDDVEILDTLLLVWPDSEKVDSLLTSAYEELKLKNVLISPEMDLFFHRKLLGLSFFSDSKVSQPSPFEIKERINLLLEKIHCVVNEYTNRLSIDEKFIYIVKFIASNIHSIKQMPECASSLLPWEEMEFCLVRFLAAQTPGDTLSCFTIDQGSLIDKLKNFCGPLEDLLVNVESINLNKTVRPSNDRDKSKSSILGKYPNLSDLYEDYEEMRDLSSLNVLSSCINIAQQADGGTRSGQLLIMRALQVIGENLKSTSDTPKLSTSMHDLLLLSLPRESQQLLKDIRNSLSHPYFLDKEETAHSRLYSNIQNDITKVGLLITEVLYFKELNKIRSLLSQVVKFETLEEFRKFPFKFSNFDKRASITDTQEVIEIKELIEEINSNIVYKSPLESKLLSEIFEMIEKSKTLKNINMEYVAGLYYLENMPKKIAELKPNKKTTENLIRGTKFTASKMLENFTSCSLNFNGISMKKLTSLLMFFYHSVKYRISSECNLKIQFLITKICNIASCGIGDIKWINEFRVQLADCNRLSSPKVKQPEVTMKDETDNLETQLKEKIAELKEILKDFPKKSQEKESPIKNMSPLFKTIKKLTLIYPDKKRDDKEFMIEILMLDILNLLKKAKCLPNNSLFLDADVPLLSGRCLRNYLAHGNDLYDILHSGSPFTAVLINALELVQNDITIKTKLGKVVTRNAKELEERYNLNLKIIQNNQEMCATAIDGNMKEFLKALKKGADIYSRTVDLSTMVHLAARGPSLEIVQFLIKNHVSPNAFDVNGQTPLHIAAAFGRENIVKFLVNEVGLLIEEQNCLGQTPLFLAAMKGHEQTVQTLISLGANTAAKDSGGDSPVHFAVKNNYLAIVKFLLKNEVSVDSNKVIGDFTPLHVASDYGHIDIALFLISNGANVNAETLTRTRPLHLAAFNGHILVVKALFDNGAEMDVSSSVSTPLWLAVETKREDIVEYLLGKGASANACCREYKHTALHMAVANGDRKIVDLLIKKADVNAARRDGFTALLYAAKKGYNDILINLFEQGARLECKDSLGSSPLHLAAVEGHNDILKSLIGKGLNVNCRNFQGLTPLHLAAALGKKETVDFLLTETDDLDAVDCKGNTPLHCCVQEGHTDVVEALLARGANVHATNNKGYTPLHRAVARPNNERIVHLLIAYNANFDVKHQFNFRTPLHIASFLGHKEAVKELVLANADLHPRTDIGETPLCLAAQGNHKSVVQILLSREIDKKTIEINHSLALCSAAKHNNKEIVDLLIAAGANVNAEGGQPLIGAVSAGHRLVAKALLTNKHIDLAVKSRDGLSLLHITAGNGDWNIGKELIKKGVKIDVECGNTTPLLIAVQNGHKEFVDVLLRNTKINASPGYMFLLHEAAARDCSHIVESLLSWGAKSDIKHDQYGTPLEIAIRNGQIKNVKLLFNLENNKQSDTSSLLQIASQSGNIDTIKFLVEIGGCNISCKNKSELQPIHTAAHLGHKAAVQYFIDNGWNQDQPDEEQTTPLFYAAARGHLDVVECLIENRASVDAVDSTGIQPIHAAAEGGNIHVVKALLQCGATYNSRDKNGRKPQDFTNDKNVKKQFDSIKLLFKAVKSNNILLVKELLDNNDVIVNANSEKSSTLLNLASWKGYQEICDILLKNGANANAVGKGKMAPLHYASQYSHYGIVKSLLKSGAMYDMKTEHGKTALDYASQNKCRAIIDLLNIVTKSFRKIQEGHIKVVQDLKKIKDIETLKAVLKARNCDGFTLEAVAVQSGFPRVDLINQILQENINIILTAASAMCMNEDYPQALSLLEQALQERIEIFGDDNPSTLEILQKIAGILYKQSKYSEALSLWEKVYEKQKKILGADIEATLETRSNIALLLYRLDRNQESWEILEDIIPKLKKIRGKNDDAYQNAKSRAVLTLDALGRHEEALQLNTETYEYCLKQLNACHPSTLVEYNNRAMVLLHLGKLDEAYSIYKKVYTARIKKLGFTHSDTMRAHRNMATVLEAQGKTDEALKIYEEVLALQNKVLGPDHIDTVMTQSSLTSFYFSQKHISKALKIHKKNKVHKQNILGENKEFYDDILETVEKYEQLSGHDLFKLNSLEPEENDIVENLLGMFLDLTQPRPV